MVEPRENYARVSKQTGKRLRLWPCVEAAFWRCGGEALQ
jgi:hypothetical protein